MRTFPIGGIHPSDNKEWSKDCPIEVMELPDQVAPLLTDKIRGNFYYNLACYKTLAGDKKGALKTFEYYTDRVIDSEEINLSNINRDSDLNALRDEPRFKACMERLAKWGDYKQKLKDAKQYVQGYIQYSYLHNQYNM